MSGLVSVNIQRGGWSAGLDHLPDFPAFISAMTYLLAVRKLMIYLDSITNGLYIVKPEDCCIIPTVS